MQPFRRLVISCHRYTELASQQCHTPLTVLDRVAFSFHHIVCLVCRRFYRQLRALNCCSKELEEKLDSEASPDFCLSHSARAKISEEISKDQPYP